MIASAEMVKKKSTLRVEGNYECMVCKDTILLIINLIYTVLYALQTEQHIICQNNKHVLRERFCFT